MLHRTPVPLPGRRARTICVSRDQPLYRQLLRTAPVGPVSIPRPAQTALSGGTPSHVAALPRVWTSPQEVALSHPVIHILPPADHPSALPAYVLPEVLLVRGSPSIPSGPRIGIVCSVRMKGALIVAMYDYAKTLNPEDGIVVGGFHSPMERQVLELLLARHIPVIVVPARNPERMRIPREWRVPMDEGRLTIVSGISGATRRPTRDLARKRNFLVAALADRVLIPYATPGGVAETMARAVVQWGKTLWTFRDEANAILLELGAAVVQDPPSRTSPTKITQQRV